jgi:hypothetical protein
MKIITSPVKRFPGTVTLSDPLTYPQYLAYVDGLRGISPEQDIPHQEYAVLPGLLKCVEKWDIPGFESITLDTFPSTPRKSVNQLINWLILEVTALVSEADDPNA